MAYIGQGIKQGTFKVLDTSGNTYNGSNVTFSLGTQVGSAAQLLVSHDGVIQKAGTDYTLASGGASITFSTAPASGASIFIVEISGAVGGTVTPSDASVTADKLNSAVLTGLTDIGAGIADADLFLVDDGAGGTLRKVAASRLSTYISPSSATDSFTITGSTPTLTIGDAGAEDTKIVFDGNAQDYYIGLDDSADDLIIGKGSTVGTTLIVSMIDTGETKITSTNSGETTPTFNIHTTGNANGAYANLLFTSAGNTTGASIKGLQSSSGNDADLLFFVNNSGTATQAMRIRFDGNVGIGTGADSTQLKVEHDTSGEKVMQLRSTHASNPRGMEMQYPNAAPDNTTNDNLIFSMEDSSTSRIKITSDGDINNHDGTYGTLSDSRIKDNITDANSQWDDIKAIKVRNYKKKDDVRDYADKAPTHIGVIAQELETSGMNGLVKETDPSKGEIQSDSSFGTLYQDGDTLPDGKEVGDIKEIKSQVKSVKYSILYMKAIKALQEAQTRIEALEARVTTLEG